jgi:hypothetical protein
VLQVAFFPVGQKQNIRLYLAQRANQFVLQLFLKAIPAIAKPHVRQQDAAQKFSRAGGLTIPDFAALLRGCFRNSTVPGKNMLNIDGISPFSKIKYGSPAAYYLIVLMRGNDQYFHENSHTSFLAHKIQQDLSYVLKI